VTRVEIPQPGGGVRTLGGTPGLDRFIQHAVLQGLPPKWDATFSARRDGFLPGRLPPQVVAQAQPYLGEDSGWVVTLDVEKFFDRVKHDERRSLVKKRVADGRGPGMAASPSRFPSLTEDSEPPNL